MKRHRKHLHGVTSIDYYACQSGLRQWNGCYKVCAAIVILILCLLLDNPWVSMVVILTMGVVNLRGNGVSFPVYLGLLKIPIAFLLLGGLGVALSISSHPIEPMSISMHWFYLYVTRETLMEALQLFLKAMGAVSALYLLALSTPASELTAVLRSIHMPKLLVELMYMIYRFIFILMDVQQGMKNAAISRLGDADFKTSCTTFGQIGGNLLILSLKKANTYYDAMISRGYEGDFPFWEEKKSVKAWQLVILGLYITVLLLIARITSVIDK